MTDNTTGWLDRQTWMSNVLDIDKLKLTDIVWPGAHNAGMDKQAPNDSALVGHWTNCQNDTFAFQLANGARAFDIRLGHDTDADQPVFYFHHNGYRSGRVLDELIEAVLSFLDRNPDEFIVLDFHQLADGDKSFDFKKLSEHLVRRLGPRTILPVDGYNTVAQLKRSSPYRRIVMAAPAHPDMDGQYFWWQITHKWHGQAFTSTTQLHLHIATTLADAPYDGFLWALSATCYSLLGGPQDIKHQINDWFSTTRSWVTRCSIINTDFFEESDIVRYCWSASSMKAVYGHSLHEPTGSR